MFTAHRMCLAALLLCTLAGVQAGDIYRWVDDQGRTHWSDVVPEKYRNNATRVDTRQYELTPEQQREAAERAARERAHAPELPEPPAMAAPTPAAPQAPAPSVVKRPVEQVTESTDCATWWRLYRESQECFGPFHTVGGGLKPEAFDHCNEIPSPELKCGPYRD
ncbi:DUF4124 domain-containing protein [Hydrogenophaga sp.]|uniref:DUF4124 domain-containing protein n=1 Tax=Hydrogenophaga sp. TaxID=1904254 RepID=UPI0025BF0A71|nr:DUF4124 domain-containing protein [Hydrogenophaga sp.]